MGDGGGGLGIWPHMLPQPEALQGGDREKDGVREQRFEGGGALEAPQQTIQRRSWGGGGGVKEVQTAREQGREPGHLSLRSEARRHSCLSQKAAGHPVNACPTLLPVASTPQSRTCPACHVR